MFLVGRSSELDRIEALLGAARTGCPGVLVVRGEAGIGKTALLDWAAERAEGFRVLRTTGVESEAELACAGLHQLLRPLLGHLDELPGPQAAALRAAFALDVAGRAERFAVYAGALGLIAAAAEQTALLCVVDDAQWLDTVSAEALVFAARRLEAERVAILFAARSSDRSSFVAAGLPELLLEGLDEQASAALLRATRSVVGEVTVEALLRVAAGNPLALVELPLALSDEQLAGSIPLGDPVPVSGAIEAAFTGRARELSSEARRALLLAAASQTASYSVVLAALRNPEGLVEAEAAGLLRVEAGAIIFRHPLARAAIYHAATSNERRDAHSGLAKVLTGDQDSESRAWHLAAAAAGPDERVAALLEDAADRAERRGSTAARAWALARAAQLTPDAGVRARRLLDAGRAAWIAGQPAHARSLLDQAAGLTEDPLLRADLALARFDATPEAQDRLYRLLVREAEAVANLDPHRAATMLSYALSYAWDTCRMDEARAVVARMRELVGQSLNRASIDVVTAIGYLGLADMRVDESVGLARQNVVAGVALNDADAVYNAAFDAELLVYAEDASARGAVDELIDRGRALGALPCLCWALIARSELELREGHLTAAYAAAAEALTIGELLGGWFYSEAAVRAARAEAVMGFADACLQHANLAEELAVSGNLWTVALAHRARGVLALALGDLDTAIHEFELATSSFDAVEHPGFLDCHADHVEALLRAGHQDAALERLRELESVAAKAGLQRTLAAARRCRALAAPDEALDEAFEDALAAPGDASVLDEARTRLCYGERLRRMGRRVHARAQLRAALEAFEQVGAEPWAEHARRELRASGGTLRPRGQPVSDELTPQELQIAVTVAEGKTNREVGAAFFISPKTVEVHLTRVYRKLDIHSRSELIRLHSTDPAKLTATARR